MKIGYARVSTENQNLERQIDALYEYGVDELYTEKITGTKACRPELDKVRLRMREGDSVVVESLSRLGRSTRDLLNLLDEFDKKGVQLISLKESVDTASPTGKLLVTVLSAISQFERDLIVQRTEEGLKAARARGRKGGRPKTDQRVIEKAIKLYQTKAYTLREVSNLCGISVATLYRALAKMK
ncbi:MAG TPA: recombinase family protein [Candidatus Ruthenibacterium avium]|uniref:Recombinase family protein n=1 Tax=Candidatus Ruthenibacterium avium TaxID=2838751 RepID=A0A9D2M225_9FIRM|nr:recombinase family protein [Candidatus Ruthenibacterium avium]